MFGEEVGSWCISPPLHESLLIYISANNSVFVDRGLKYIDEVTLVSEAAKSFPAFLVPYVQFQHYRQPSKLISFKGFSRILLEVEIWIRYTLGIP